MLHGASGLLKIQDAKICHLHSIAQLCRAISLQLRHVSTHTQPFLALFPGLPGWAGARRNLLLDFMVPREDNRGRHTNNPAGHHSIPTNQRATSVIPHFYAVCLSCYNPPNLSWLATGT